jgi:hypothetical protein
VQKFELTTLGFCTISMHIILGTCVPNLRGRGWVEHTQMQLALKRGTKKFYYTIKSLGIFSEITFSLVKNPNSGYILRSWYILILAKKKGKKGNL